MKDIKDIYLDVLAESLDRANVGPITIDSIIARLYQLHAEHEALKEQTRWIPVTERMPTEEERRQKNNWFFVCVFNGSDFGVSHVDDFKSSGVTHWKRIATPKDKL